MKSIKKQYWFFVLLTFIYFLILHKYLGITLDSVKQKQPNEIGDFLAGVFSPLAFLFLILGYLQNNKNLEQNSEAITQQAKALEQQAQALTLQAAELKLSNEALMKQVDEMEKSVEAQQNMFQLAERQYEASVNEKAESKRPKLSLIGSLYFRDSDLRGSYNHRFDLTIENKGEPLKELKIVSNNWSLQNKNDRTNNTEREFKKSYLDNSQKLNFLFYINGSNTVPFQNDILKIIYTDLDDNEHVEEYKLVKNKDLFVKVIKSIQHH